VFLPRFVVDLCAIQSLTHIAAKTDKNVKILVKNYHLSCNFDKKWLQPALVR